MRDEQCTLRRLTAALREHRPELDAASYLWACSTTNPDPDLADLDPDPDPLSLSLTLTLTHHDCLIPVGLLHNHP